MNGDDTREDIEGLRHTITFLYKGITWRVDTYNKHVAPIVTNYFQFIKRVGMNIWIIIMPIIVICKIPYATSHQPPEMGKGKMVEAKKKTYHTL